MPTPVYLLVRGFNVYKTVQHVSPFPFTLAPFHFLSFFSSLFSPFILSHSLPFLPVTFPPSYFHPSAHLLSPPIHRLPFSYPFPSLPIAFPLLSVPSPPHNLTFGICGYPAGSVLQQLEVAAAYGFYSYHNHTVNVIFPPYGRKLSVKFRYFPSVGTEIKCYHSLYSVRENLLVSSQQTANWSFSSHSLILIEWWWLPNLSILRNSTHSKTHISGMCQLAGHSWKILHSVLSCRLIWQSWQSYCNWFYQGNPFLPPTVIFVSLILY